MDPAAREWLDEKFRALNQRFTAQDRTLERVERQTTLTNGRVGKLETSVAGIIPRLDNHDRELGEIKDANEPIDTEELIKQLTTAVSSAIPAGSHLKVEATTGENRGITQRDVWIVLGTIGTVFGVWKVLWPLIHGGTP